MKKPKRIITAEFREKLRANMAKARAARISKKDDKIITVANEPQMMMVTQIPINNRIVIARDSDNKLQTVYVGNNATFVYGDKIKVQPHTSQSGIWQLIGQPPRDKRRPMAA